MQTAAPTTVSPMVTAADRSMKSLNGSVSIMTAMPIVSSRNRPDQNQVAPWKNRCSPGWWVSGCLSATTSAASLATSGLCVGAVLANMTHMARLASGNCNRYIHTLPVKSTTAVCRVSTAAEIISSDDTVETTFLIAINS